MKKYFAASLAICVLAAQLTPLQVLAKSGTGIGDGGITPVTESCRKPVMIARRSIALKQVTAAQILDNRVAQRDVQRYKAENFSQFEKSISNLKGGGSGWMGCVCTPFAPCPKFCFQTTAANEQYARTFTLTILSEAKQYEKNASAGVLAAIQDFRDAVSAASSTRTAAISSLRSTLFNAYDSGLADRLETITDAKNTRLTSVNNAYTAWQGRCATPPVEDDTRFVSSVALAKGQYDNTVYNARGSHGEAMENAFKAYMSDINEELETYAQTIRIARMQLKCAVDAGAEYAPGMCSCEGEGDGCGDAR